MADIFDEAKSIGHAGISAGVERRLALFAASMLEISWTGSDPICADIQEEAQRLGLVVETKYDPAVHHDPSGASEPGDTYFEIAADVRGLLDGSAQRSDETAHTGATE